MDRLTDSCQRTMSYLRLSVTDRCNLRCIYCLPVQGFKLLKHADILTYEEMVRLTKLALSLNMTKVRLTGGEPLVRLGFVDFVRSLKALPVPDLRLTTNGTLLAEKAAGLFEAGIHRINVSLDTLDQAKYRYITGGGDLKQVLDGLDQAQAVGFSPIKINVVVMRGLNSDEVESFAKLTLETPLHVRFIEFMPLDRNGWKPGLVLTSDEILQRLQRLGPLTEIPPEPNDGPARRFRLGQGPGEVGLISPLSHHFCPTCNRLRITSDGKLLTCLFSSEEVDLKGPLRSGASDEELLAIIRAAVASKPDRHHLAQHSGPVNGRSMCSIGG